MKNYHNSSKFILIQNLEPSVVVCSILGDFSYLHDASGKPLFLNRGKLYLALGYKIEFPYVVDVEDAIPYEDWMELFKRFLS